MLNEQWFLNHQKILLWFVNTQFGKRFFCIDGKKSSVGKNKIIKILPNAIFWKGKKKNQLIAEFRVHTKYAKRIYYALLPLWKLLHFWDMFWYPRFNFGFDSTGDLFPAAGANSPVDGYVARDIRGTGSETFSTIRTSAGNFSNETDAFQTIPFLESSTTTNEFDALYRDIICWDTSSIGGGNTVDTATASLATEAPIAKTNGLGEPDIYCVGATPASTSDLVDADYGQVQFTSFANITYANWSAVDGTYNDFTLNADGRANISLTGISRFGFILSWDLTGTFGGTWASNVSSYFKHSYADTAGTSVDPKLVVTYTLSSSSLLNKIW